MEHVEPVTEMAQPTIKLEANKAGTIDWSGACSGPADLSLGVSEVTLSTTTGQPFPDALVSGCSLSLTDAFDRRSPEVALEPFRVSAALPTMTLTVGVPPVTNRPRPQIEIVSSEEVSLEGIGPCVPNPRKLLPGPNAVVLFGPYPDGLVSGCGLVGTDLSGNSTEPIAIDPFRVDMTNPVVSLESSPPSLTNDRRPIAVVKTNERVRALVGNGCHGTADYADDFLEVRLGSEERPLSDGHYDRCTISVYDEGSNKVDLNVPRFTVDATPPTIVLHTQPAPSDNVGLARYLDVEIDEPATLVLEGCDAVLELHAPFTGRRQLLLSSTHGGPLYPGVFACQLSAVDTATNRSATLHLEPFEIDRLTVYVTDHAHLTRNPKPGIAIWISAPATLAASTGCGLDATAFLEGVNELSLTSLDSGPLHDGVHRCTFEFSSTDDHFTLTLTPFTVDTVPPTLEIVATNLIPTNPTFTVSLQEPATIVMNGGCGASAAVLPVGQSSVVILDPHGDALPDDDHVCGVAAVDAIGNVSAFQTLPPFTVDRGAPILTLITPPIVSGPSLSRTFELSTTRRCGKGVRSTHFPFPLPTTRRASHQRALRASPGLRAMRGGALGAPA